MDERLKTLIAKRDECINILNETNNFKEKFIASYLKAKIEFKILILNIQIDGNNTRNKPTG